LADDYVNGRNYFTKVKSEVKKDPLVVKTPADLFCCPIALKIVLSFAPGG